MSASDAHSKAPGSTLGAVRYLNMIPWFWGQFEHGMRLSATPSALNADLAEGRIQAACVSAVAGFRAGLELAQPLSGVACQDRVWSVTVEGLPVSHPSQRDFWPRVYAAKGDLGAVREVKLLTAGASAHSLWLVENLLAAQGLKVQVQIIPAAHNLLSPAELTREWPVSEGQALALLVIGDDALIRRLQCEAIEEWDFAQKSLRLSAMGAKPSARSVQPLSWGRPSLRADVGEWYRHHMGLPCVFAAWFCNTQAQKPLVAQALIERVEGWNSLGLERQLAQAWDFLNRNPRLHSGVLLERFDEWCPAYLGDLVHALTGDFTRTLQGYERALQPDLAGSGTIFCNPTSTVTGGGG